jgi:hypothetical protein
MQAIQPGHLVLSVFGLAQGRNFEHKAQTFGLVFSLIGAFIVVIGAALVLNLAISRFGDHHFFAFSPAEEKTAYLPSQVISAQMAQGYMRLK